MAIPCIGLNRNSIDVVPLTYGVRVDIRPPETRSASVLRNKREAGAAARRHQFGYLTGTLHSVLPSRASLNDAEIWKLHLCPTWLKVLMSLLDLCSVRKL
jgi:hypothetical protein